MPELPEVEVTRLGLVPLINGTVYNVEVRNFSLRWPVNPNIKFLLPSGKYSSFGSMEYDRVRVPAATVPAINKEAILDLVINLT